MFNPEEPLAGILKATGRDEQTVAKLMSEVVTDFRTPKLDIAPDKTKYFDYIQPLTESNGDVQLQAKAIGHGLAPNGMSIDIYDGGGANLFPASAGPWQSSFYPPAATRLSIFHGGPYQYRDLRTIPTAAIYDYSKPESVAGIPNVLRVAQGGIDFEHSRFVVEQLGANGTVESASVLRKRYQQSNPRKNRHCVL